LAHFGDIELAASLIERAERRTDGPLMSGLRTDGPLMSGLLPSLKNRPEELGFGLDAQLDAVE
jgi:hypothetical protein